MAKTESKMVELGSIAPNFQLRDVISNQMIKLVGTQQDIATVIMFICNHCPYVKHIHAELCSVAHDYQKKGVRFIAINSNDIESYPDDSPENMKIMAHQNHYTFPYVFDETQEVAKAYHATCTPDFFIYDQHDALVYRGQFDDSRPGNNVPVTGNTIKKALDCLLHNQPMNINQKPSLGCNIKWKK